MLTKQGGGLLYGDEVNDWCKMLINAVSEPLLNKNSADKARRWFVIWFIVMVLCLQVVSV